MFSCAVRIAVPLAVAAGLSGGSLALADSQESRSSQHHQGGNGSQGSNHNQSERTSGQRSFSAWDEEWLKMSIEGDRFEISGGRLAEQKGTTAVVRALGARLVADHSKSLADAVDEAKEQGIDVPDSPSPSQQWELRVVTSFSGKVFDRWYSDLEVQDHMQDIQETQDEIDKGRNQDIKQLAKDDLPVLQEHLKLAQQALAASQ
jgi:putative membrane protein